MEHVSITDSSSSTFSIVNEDHTFTNPVRYTLNKEMSHNARKSPHNWSSEATKVLLKCAIESYAACGSNKKGVHKTIAEKYNRIVENIPYIEPIDKSKVRHKYDSLRREWVKWKSLCNKTVSGWDIQKQTVTGSEEWWNDCVKEFGHVILRYKRGPIDNFELMQQLFQGTNATGQTSYTPTANEEPPQQQTPHVGSFSGANKARSVGRRRRGETDDKLCEIIDPMHDKHMKKSCMESKSPNINNTNSVNSIGNSVNYANIVARLQRIGEEGELDFGEALTIVMQSDNKEIFNVLSDELAKSWLLSAIADKQHVKEYQTYLINQSGANK